MNIVVTGASRGIGYETVLQLAKDQSNAIYALARNEPNLLQLKQECQNLGNQNITVRSFDLQHENITELVKSLSQVFNHVDVIINNAGILIKKPFKEFTSKEAQTVFDVNFFRPLELIRGCIHLLEKSDNPHVVNITSMAGFQGRVKYPGLSIYSASKAALNSLTECLASEYKDSNIRFNALALGATQTEMLAKAFPGLNAPVSANTMGTFIADFAMKGSKIYNGAILPVTISNP